MKIKQQFSGTAIGTKLAEPCTCIYIARGSALTNFSMVTVYWLYCIIWTYSEENLKEIFRRT